MISNSIFDMTVVQLVCAMRSNPAITASLDKLAKERRDSGQPALTPDEISAMFVSVAVTQANVLSVMLTSLREGTPK